MHVEFTVHGVRRDAAGRDRLVRDHPVDVPVNDTRSGAWTGPPLATGDRIGVGPSVEGAS